MVEFKVLKVFKCRFQNRKVFYAGDKYSSVDEDHTKKLVKLGYIKGFERAQEPEKAKEVKKPKKQVKKQTKAKKKDE